MSNAVKPGIRKQQRSLSDRLDMVEQSYARVLFAMKQRNDHVDQRLNNLEEQSEALIVLGPGKLDVETFINEKRVERARAASEQEKAGLQQGIDAGYVSAVDKIAEKSLVVGRFVDKSGNVEEPGRIQLVMPGIAESFRAQLLGQAVGMTLTLPNEMIFEVQEIYDLDEEKAKVSMAAKDVKAVETELEKVASVATADESSDAAPGSGND